MCGCEEGLDDEVGILMTAVKGRCNASSSRGNATSTGTGTSKDDQGRNADPVLNSSSSQEHLQDHHCSKY